MEQEHGATIDELRKRYEKELAEAQKSESARAPI
jgi:hypothetical protein